MELLTSADVDASAKSKRPHGRFYEPLNDRLYRALFFHSASEVDERSYFSTFVKPRGDPYRRRTEGSHEHGRAL